MPYLIWLVRIALPVILFWLWCRAQSAPAKNTLWSAPGEISHSRVDLLEVRKATGSEIAPPALKTLSLADEATLQKHGLGQAKAPANARRDSKAKRNDKQVRPSLDSRRQNTGELEGGSAEGGQTLTPVSEAFLSQEERMHIESLLNFVAFSHKEHPERIFLPDTGRPPPPPPRRRKSLSEPPSLDEAATDAGAAKANAEAQMVLKGVVNPKIKLKRADIAKDLYRQLYESSVPTFEANFTLMVEACINASDLKGASEFLMKMESAGFCPDSELLDKVMGLYAESRNTAETADGKAGGVGGQHGAGGRTLWGDMEDLEPSRQLASPAWGLDRQRSGRHSDTKGSPPLRTTAPTWQSEDDHPYMDD